MDISFFSLSYSWVVYSCTYSSWVIFFLYDYAEFGGDGEGNVRSHSNQPAFVPIRGSGLRCTLKWVIHLVESQFGGPKGGFGM